jgi:serine/threonine protein kinase
MNQPSKPTLEGLIAAFFQQLNDGEQPDPHRFVEGHPEFRDDFLSFVTNFHQLARGRYRRPSDSEPRQNGIAVDDSWVLGGYHIDFLLGRGGMASVFHGKQVAGDREAAIKVIDTRSAATATAQQRFRREADAIRSLDHPHIVPLIGFGTEGNYSYLVLELIDGCTLADWIVAEYDSHELTASTVSGEKERRAVSKSQPDFTLRASHSAGQRTQVMESETHAGEPNNTFEYRRDVRPIAAKCFQASRIHGDFFKDVAELIATACDALHSAHERGVIHRDVKPSNLMIDRTGKIWLTDFGLASLGEATTVVTATGQLVGTPCYMSPEQASGENKLVDRRSDIYAVGSTLYEMATGHRCFSGDRVSVLVKLTTGQMTPPSKVCPEIPRVLEAIILKAMSFSPADRYQSAAELAADLRCFARDQPTLARSPRWSDRAIRWLTVNPRTSIAILAGVFLLGLTAYTIQFTATQRLNSVNQELTSTNQALERSSDQLARTNQDLDRSRKRLQRHLYIADMAAAYRAYAQQDYDAVNQMLAQHLPSQTAAPGKIDQRGFEWWLLRNLTSHPQVIRKDAHPGGANEITLMPDKKSFLTVGCDGWIRRWSLEPCELIAEWNVGGRLDAIAVHPQQEQWVTGSNIPEGVNPVTTRSSRTGRVIEQLTGHDYSVESAAYSPNGKWIATAGRYDDVLLHDAEGTLRGKLLTGSRNESLHFSPDGRSLLVVHRQQVDGELRQTLRRLNVPDLEMQSEYELSFDPLIFCFSGEGERLAVADKSSWVVVSEDGSSVIAERSNVRGRIRCLALDEKGERVAFGCDNGLIYVWNLNSEGNDQDRSATRVISAGTLKITDVAFSDSEHLIATSEDGTVQIWSLNRNPVEHLERGNPILALASQPSDSEQLYARGVHGDIYRLDLGSLEYSKLAHLDPDRFGKLAATSNGQLIVAAGQGQLGIFTNANGRWERQLEKIPQGVNIGDLQFVDDDRSLLVLLNDRIQRYSRGDWDLCDEIVFPTEGAFQLLVSPDQSTLLVCQTGKLFWIDAETFESTKDLTRQFGDHTGIQFSSDGSMIALGHQDGTIELLDANDTTRLRLVRGHRDSIYGLVFIDNDRTLISSSSSGMIRFWDVASGRELGQLQMDKSRANRIHFNESSQKLFAFGRHDPLKVWSGQRSR